MERKLDDGGPDNCAVLRASVDHGDNEVLARDADCMHSALW